MTKQNATHFHAGHNDAGYLPESDVETFDTFADAASYMADELRRAGEAMASWSDPHDCDDIPCPTFGDECPWQLAGQFDLAATELSEMGPDHVGWGTYLSDGRSLPVAWWINACHDDDCGPEDDEPARNLPSEVAEPVIATGHELRGSVWEATVPEAGGSWSYGDWTTSTAEEATHFLLPYTTYSDYSGSTVERSNCDALLRDYPDTFVEVYGGHGTRGLMLPADWTPPEDGRADLLDVLAGLADYCVYDEEAMSQLEMDLAEEAWDAYLRYDVVSDLRKTGVDDDVLDAYEDSGALRERVYRGIYESDQYPYAETAVDVAFPGLDGIVAEIAAELGTDDDGPAPHTTNGQWCQCSGCDENTEPGPLYVRRFDGLGTDWEVRWHGGSTFNIYVDDVETDVFTRYGDDKGNAPTAEQARQFVEDWAAHSGPETGHLVKADPTSGYLHS